MFDEIHNESAAQSAPPVSAAPDAAVDPIWQVVTHLSSFEVRATDLDVDDNTALLFCHTAAVTKDNSMGIVAVVPWAMLNYAFDPAYGTVIDPASRGDQATEPGA